MKLNERGKTVIIFTKDEDLAKQYRKRMITLDFGKIVSDESAPEEKTPEIVLPEISE